jgi:GTP1/Obg family GTP-binding protein
LAVLYRLDLSEKKRKLDKSEQSLERKALNTIGSILSGNLKFDERFSEKIDELKPFLQTLKEILSILDHFLTLL